MLTHKDLPVVSFESAAAFEKWLSENYQQEQALWLRYFKKGSNLPSIKHDEAVEVALCWGWIDGLLNKYDDISYLVRFTPRRAKSIWSKVNVAKVERLLQEGRMQPSGMLQVENAKKDGRWARAYEPASKMEIPQDFIDLVKQDQKAFDFYQTLNKANLYAIGFRISTIADPKKRLSRMNQILEKLKNGLKFHN
jgi:uncharacterized protein YdeI (YjbR/CyaY-like superfamily)